VGGLEEIWMFVYREMFLFTYDRSFGLYATPCNCASRELGYRLVLAHAFPLRD